ncbi:hypothetical protein B0H10DRAFT_2130623 [Mycena sp. CBHHK59/15]|nr:hypothetical protein B0H10DRAFT_2130623 [Mycena sp. CBHHK59/15]
MVALSALAYGIISLLASGDLAQAHEHHDELSEAEVNTPVDSILWIHIFLQAAVWGVLFPIGMVLGITRSRWHVPLQSAGFALTAGGYVLGHSHKGRMFLPSVHGSFASVLFVPIALQLVLGIYLKLHIHEQSVRPWVVRLHGVVGKAYPILGWTQMLFGAITFRGYCRGDDLGQCLAHYIMGSGFIAYGVIMTIMLLVGEAWVRRRGRSPEWWDSILGVLWWAGGLLGIFLARNNKRNHLMVSTKACILVHAMFGYTVMLAGLTRIIEVCFFSAPTKAPDVVDDDNVSDHTLTEPSPRYPSRYPAPPVDTGAAAASKAFRHLPAFVSDSVSSVLFMSATDEELQFVHDNEMDHVTYILIMFSIAFLLYALIVFVIHLYATTGRNAAAREDNSIAMTAPRSKWYSRVPNAEAGPMHVVGEDDEE